MIGGRAKHILFAEKGSTDSIRDTLPEQAGQAIARIGSLHTTISHISALEYQGYKCLRGKSLTNEPYVSSFSPYFSHTCTIFCSGRASTRENWIELSDAQIHLTFLLRFRRYRYSPTCT